MLQIVGGLSLFLGLGTAVVTHNAQLGATTFGISLVALSVVFAVTYFSK